MDHLQSISTKRIVKINYFVVIMKKVNFKHLKKVCFHIYITLNYTFLN